MLTPAKTFYHAVLPARLSAVIFCVGLLFSCKESAPKPSQITTQPVQPVTAPQQVSLASDSIAFRYIHYSQVDKNCDSSKAEECTRFVVQYPLFQSDEPELDAVYQLLDSLIEIPPGYSRIEEALQQRAENFLQEYYATKEEFPEHPPWLMEKIATVMLNQSGLLSIKFIDYYYMGGAHPVRNIYFYNYDLRQKKKLRLDELIKPEGKVDLLRIAEKKFRRTWGIPDTSTFSHYGFEFPEDRFKLNQNFLLGKNGITFLFNSYEIAPYAMGITEFKIPYREIAAIVKNNSTLAGIVAH